MWTRLRQTIERLAVAHFVAYPIAFLWAVGAIPLTIHLSVHDLDALNGDELAIQKLIVRRLAWPAAAAFATAHVAVAPWLAIEDTKRGLRVFLILIACVAGMGLLAGGGSWLWLLMR